jgi:hypothetical protein
MEGRQKWTYTPASVQVVPVTESGLTDVFARTSRAGRAVADAARSAMMRVDGCMVVGFVLLAGELLELRFGMRNKEIYREIKQKSIPLLYNRKQKDCRSRRNCWEEEQ